MFERPQLGERAILVHIDFPKSDSQEDLQEFCELSRSAGVHQLEMITGVRQVPHAKYFVGVGKAEEIRDAVMTQKANLVILNHSLSPAQERNLETLCKCRVLDRTGLILDIFAQRAKTSEGKLQVELAQLNYLATRLVRGWTHLERQKGGIGLRGPGETQLETDRRLIRDRIKTIHQRLDKVKKHRQQNRYARYRSAIPTASIIGYTNAGKSSLFNSLTHAEIYTANQLFATLDPTSRRVELGSMGNAILTDTVGFIRHLPPDLIVAFRATLEETRDANLLLHVVDVSSYNRNDNIAQVNLILEDIGAETVPCLMVYNKIDLLESFQPRIERSFDDKPVAVWVSAKTGMGLDLLIRAIAEHLYGDPVYRTLSLTAREGKLRAELYELGAVLNEEVDEEGNCLISVCISKADFIRMFGEMHLSS